MFTFKFLPPIGWDDEVLPMKSYVSKENDVVEAYKEVRNYIWDTPLPNAQLIRIDYVLDENNQFILVDDIMKEVNKRGLVRREDYL